MIGKNTDHKSRRLFEYKQIAFCIHSFFPNPFPIYAEIIPTLNLFDEMKKESLNAKYSHFHPTLNHTPASTIFVSTIVQSV